MTWKRCAAERGGLDLEHENNVSNQFWLEGGDDTGSILYHEETACIPLTMQRIHVQEPVLNGRPEQNERRTMRIAGLFI